MDPYKEINGNELLEDGKRTGNRNDCDNVKRLHQ